ncbi:MAG TPA: aldo/keto reductase [Micropepsaceae bacterium]|nr:aldo/keto reductase [Micropepsaceae bacterium]
MQTRKLGPFEISALGLGCMSLSHAYGTPPDEQTAGAVLLKALDLGYRFIDTAALYGFGANETLIGNVLKTRRRDYVLASKCGMFRNAQGLREVDGRPEVLTKTCEDSLKRLQTDVIDLYYLHRWDKRIPIEDSIGAMSDMVKEGKVRTIGLSEVSADTLRKAHRVHPIAAVQTEYSLWTRNPEIAVLDACRELGVAFVAFSPLARGFLTGDLRDMTVLPPKDIRLAMPRFQGEHFQNNLKLLDGFSAIARENDCTMAQLALAWLLAKARHIVPIPGTTRLDHLAENARGSEVRLLPDAMERMEALINANTVSGPRYNAATLPEIDTEGS